MDDFGCDSFDDVSVDSGDFSDVDVSDDVTDVDFDSLDCDSEGFTDDIGDMEFEALDDDLVEDAALEIDDADLETDMSEELDADLGLADDLDIDENDDVAADELEEAEEDISGVLDGLTDEELEAAILDEDISDTPAFSEALNNPELFDEYEKGEYEYRESESGKSAFGSLDLTDDPQRNAYAQRTVGGEDRLENDDGGHLIGARFGGEGGTENLDAQARDLNRGTYKAMENEWADALEDGDKVFADVETYKSNGSERPDAYMGYSIVEHDDGSRNWDAFSFQNASKEEQQEWADIVESTDVNDGDILS